MMPTKNGVVIHLLSHNMAVRADVYEYPGLYVFRVNNHQFDVPPDDEVDFRVTEYSDWFESYSDHGTMLVLAHHCMGTAKWRAFKEREHA